MFSQTVKPILLWDIRSIQICYPIELILRNWSMIFPRGGSLELWSFLRFRAIRFRDFRGWPLYYARQAILPKLLWMWRVRTVVLTSLREKWVSEWFFSFIRNMHTKLAAIHRYFRSAERMHMQLVYTPSAKLLNSFRRLASVWKLPTLRGNASKIHWVRIWSREW